MGYLGGLMLQNLGQPPIEITLRRTARARRFSLRVGQGDGRVVLSLPLRAREAEAMAFARAHEGWIRAALAKLPRRAPLTFGATLPFEGEDLVLTPASKGARVYIDQGQLLAPPDLARLPARLTAFFKLCARDRLAVATDFYAAQLGKTAAQIALRDTRTRWGSCTAAGALMYNWRLIMAPPAVLRYVAAHEVAHLVQMNHSPAFWDVVSQLYPNWQEQRAWLRQNGARLQAVEFKAQSLATQPLDSPPLIVTG